MLPTNFILPKKQVKLENDLVFTLAGFGQQMWQFDKYKPIYVPTYVGANPDFHCKRNTNTHIFLP